MPELAQRGRDYAHPYSARKALGLQAGGLLHYRVSCAGWITDRWSGLSKSFR